MGSNTATTRELTTAFSNFKKGRITLHQIANLYSETVFQDVNTQYSIMMVNWVGQRSLEKARNTLLVFAKKIHQDATRSNG